MEENVPAGNITLRRPEKNRSNSCTVCQRPDEEEDMVQCDQCDCWQHYSCAGVDDTVASRSWVCSSCANTHVEETASLRSVSSRNSSVPELGDSMNLLVERQQLEKARAELDLQRRHLEERQQLLEDVLAADETRSHRSDVSVTAVSTIPMISRRQAVSPLDRTRIPTPPLPGAPRVAYSRRSVPRPAVPQSSASPFIPPMVAIPCTVVEQFSSKSSRETNDTQDALRALKHHVEACEAEGKPTVEQLTVLQEQLNKCWKLFQSSSRAPDYQPRPSRQTGAIPKDSRVLPAVPEKYRFPQDREREITIQAGVPPVSQASASMVSQASLLLVNQTDAPPVSRSNESIKTYNDQADFPGKRQALNSFNTNILNKDENDNIHINCPTTNNTREQLRYDARPGINDIPTNYPREQMQNRNARPGETTVFSSTNIPAEKQIRETPARSVESNELSQPPRLSVTVPRNLINLSDVPGCPTQQQLAARQSMPKELPRFSGDPADWPVFISSYNFTNEACGWTKAENMLRLQRCLTGDAFDAVRSRLVLPATVPQVIETLRMRYGRPELLINTLLNKVRSIPAPRPDNLEGLIDLGMAVQALVDHMDAAEQHAHLSNPSLLQELVAKLPASQKLMWAGYKRGFRNVDLRIFSDYMKSVVEDASSVVTFELPSKGGNTRDRSKPKGFVNTHSAETSSSKMSSSEPKEPPKQFNCGVCNKSVHRMGDCDAFKALSVDERWRKVRALGHCQVCLYNHGRRACRKKMTCDIEGCQFRHHSLLHSSRGPPWSAARQTLPAEHHTHHQSTSPSLFRIIPVTLHGNTRSINTYAFLDEGSDLTLVESDLAASLGAEGSPQPLCLRWTGNTSRIEKQSRRISLNISAMGQKKRHPLLNARTVESLSLPCQTFQVEEAAKKHAHLRGIPVIGYQNAKPKILIGIDNLHLALPLKTKGDGTGPVAVKTRLGWCVYGPRRSGNNNAYNFHVCGCTCDEELHESVKQFFVVEGTGTNHTDIPLTKEEERALTLLEATTQRYANRFETGLLWKNDHIEFPDSYGMAVRRLECLERRMERDPALKENLHRQICEYEAKGYTHQATKAEMDAADPRRVWYLPIGAVTNPKKPGKVRIIWDAAAKVDGVSLNSALLKGPDQLSSLPAVLFRFRQYGVAVTSDIQEMFHQIRIREEDKQSQRFLWRSNPSEKPVIYLMDVATFGSTCSPASAQFVKNRNAELHANLYPEASIAIVSNHYVDDYLASFSTEEEAAQVASDVRYVHGNGGFKLHNWRSNSRTVLRRLGEKQNESEKIINLVDGEKTERVLGMLWSPATDELSFSTQMSDEVQNLLNTATRPTKRQVLRCVMTLFDPLGLLSPFIIHGKVLIQDLWREGTAWDEQIGDEVYAKWQRWIKMVKFIGEVRIPRCYFHRATRKTYYNSEMHVFVDASEVAYSCAIYLRTFDEAMNPQCCLIAAKSKVAPLKPWSIPRMELQGCLLGVRWSKFVKENHDIPVSNMILWTDSRTALAWIKADPRNYRQFVSCRVGEILEHTASSDWRWVPSKCNPADEATKWGSGPYFERESKWFQGPTFLRLPEEEWPRIKDSVTTTTEEMRASVLHHSSYEAVIDFERFSSWDRLHRATAYVLRFLRNAATRNPKYTGHLRQAELQAAEETILKLVQKESYPDEIAVLSFGATNKNDQRVIGKKSTIYQMTPMLDECGLLRERGRIGETKNVPYSTRHPVILPRKHSVTKLLVHRFHRYYRHGNAETVVNEIRQLYTISRLRALVKSISHNCPLCKIRRARPIIPLMAPLPPARLAHHERAFTYTGVDYFGPLLVKLGRANVKRWIALFTCLTVRAVHLEIAYTLSTASFISCVRRFVGRRGPPAEFFSDNGTNFQGAERVLQHQITQKLSATFTSAKTKWTFIPPGAPHMGGAWERLVQSVKAAMAEAYAVGKLDDEGLQTLVVEAESIVNSRPLTYLPLESEESEALTPNHFLLLSSNGVKEANKRDDEVEPGYSSEVVRRQILGDSWPRIQNQLNVFWQRWLREYLPVIRRQPKWFEETKSLEPGDLVLVAEPTKRNGWERGRIIRTIQNPDGRNRRAIVKIGSGTVLRPVSRLALLDVKKGEVPENSRLHPGETVTTGEIELATLPTNNPEGATKVGNATRRRLKRGIICQK